MVVESDLFNRKEIEEGDDGFRRRVRAAMGGFDGENYRARWELKKKMI